MVLVVHLSVRHFLGVKALESLFSSGLVEGIRNIGYDFVYGEEE